MEPQQVAWFSAVKSPTCERLPEICLTIAHFLHDPLARRCNRRFLLVTLVGRACAARLSGRGEHHAELPLTAGDLAPRSNYTEAKCPTLNTKYYE